jgi:hypothetical protein
MERFGQDFKVKYIEILYTNKFLKVFTKSSDTNQLYGIFEVDSTYFKRKKDRLH